jgi:hypothetical protein
MCARHQHGQMLVLELQQLRLQRPRIGVVSQYSVSQQWS